MELAHSTRELNDQLAAARESGRKVALVPTMGALHKGHLSLVNRALQDGYFVVVSIFVNPKQFSDDADLADYPRTLGVDARLLTDAGVDLLFAPSNSDIYPPGVTLKQPQAAELANSFEGEYRPGHFDGMLLVVNRLFDLVNPSAAYFGEKDFQQLALVRNMVRQQIQAGEREPMKVVACQTVRDEHGLAFSSRNIRIKPEHLGAARSLYRALVAGAKAGNTRDAMIAAAKAQLDPITRLEYLELVAEDSFEILDQAKPGARLLIAAWVGEVRLIDNLMIGEA
jgi:pantoate--beta-alanine ligase